MANNNSKFLGKRFGLLTVTSGEYIVNGKRFVDAKCDCGEEKQISIYRLGKTTSCGCAIGEKYAPEYDIPDYLNHLRHKLIFNDRVLVFEDGTIFRKKGNLLYRASFFYTSRKNRYQSFTYSILNSKGKKIQVHEYVHRAVAIAFLENEENLKLVNHIDGDTTNNHVANLEWCNNSENLKHAYKNNLVGKHKYSNPCIFCRRDTISKFMVCATCEAKLDTYKARVKKISSIEKELSIIDRDKLSKRELAIINMRINGNTYGDIGARLGVTYQRVQTIVKELKETKRKGV